MARPGEDVRVVAAGARARAGVPRGWTVAVVVAALVGFLLGAALDGGGESKVAPNPTPGPHGFTFGVPTGFAHSAPGAAAALFTYSAALGDPRLLVDPSRRKQVLSALATDRCAATFAGRSATALEVARRGPLGRSLAAGARTIYFATPIAYRVVSYTTSEAVIEGWGVSVVGNDEGLAPQAAWGKTLTTLRWERGDWRVDAVESKDGPTPSLADRQEASSPADFLARLEGLRGVRHAP